MSENYYSYLKKYSPRFIAKYETWTHHAWGRKSNFLQLVNSKGALVMTGRAFILPGIRYKNLVYYSLAAICCFDVWGIWFYQDIYNKYTYHKWNTYQPWMYKTYVPKHYEMDPLEEKKPFTRVKYQDRIKIIYDGEDNQNITSPRRLRYR